MTKFFLELSGIEPKASRMRNERSTTELQPRIHIFFNFSVSGRGYNFLWDNLNSQKKFLNESFGLS